MLDVINESSQQRDLRRCADTLTASLLSCLYCSYKWVETDSKLLAHKTLSAVPANTTMLNIV